MIYCLYSSTTNALLGIYDVAPDPQGGQGVQALNREAPDFAREEWNPAVLDFFTKQTATLTHLEFRRRFTAAEQEAIDEFNALFESHPALTTEQKRKVRTGLKNFESANGVTLTDSDIPGMLGLYTALGLLAPGRAAEILA